ncbi:hypothetical protein NIES4102_09370 [Chondrocystis sp. NIES-4102]|nr:hypothetical protein NIES4102_09370 [Chondrocystis sp. NIES-4102]
MKLYLTLIVLLCSILASVEKINAELDPLRVIMEGNDNDNEITLGYAPDGGEWQWW